MYIHVNVHVSLLTAQWLRNYMYMYLYQQLNGLEIFKIVMYIHNSLVESHTQNGLAVWVCGQVSQCHGSSPYHCIVTVVQEFSH